jgi:transposase
MLADVRQATIRTVIERSAATGALVHTDEYDGFARLGHARGEYAPDEDGDGCCEVHVDTAEGL